MGKISFLDVYKDRIKQINIDCKKAIAEKNWTQLAKLIGEKARLEDLIEKG